MNAGAPPLRSSLWLQEAIRHAPPQVAQRGYAAYFSAWRLQYFSCHGYYPVDARRSFRAAVAGALARVRREERP